MKPLFRVLLPAICLALVSVSLAPAVLADRGMIPISDVSVYGPGQKAIIAWDGEEEILILSTDVRASGDSQVLEILPLPSPPQVGKGDFASFEEVDRVIKEHFPVNLWDRYKGEGTVPPGVEVIFHEKIGAHDITVVKAGDPAELVQWAEKFLRDTGIEHRISSPQLESVVGDYIDRDMNFFVFDLIELSSEPRSIEPIKYRFDTEFLYYPLKISTMAEGWTDINLFLLTPEKLEPSWLHERSELPGGMEIAEFHGRRETQSVQFEITQGELVSIDKDVASLFGDGAWLTAMSYHGDLAHLNRDLRIHKAIANAELLFDYYPGRCTSKHSSEATIGILGDMIVVYGAAVTPTPCYELEARWDISGTFVYPPLIIIDIIPKEQPGICVECVGEVPFRAKIADLVPGRVYDVIVQYSGEPISKEGIYLPLSNPVRSDYTHLPDEVVLETIDASVDGFTFQADGLALAPEVLVRVKVKGNDHRFHLAYLKLDEGRNSAVVEVNNMPAIIRLSENCRLKISDRQMFLNDGYWLLPVRMMPDEAAGVMKEELKSIELKAVDGRAIYEVQGVRCGKFLGWVPREVKIETQVDAITGEVIKEQRPWWAMFCW